MASPRIKRLTTGSVDSFAELADSEVVRVDLPREPAPGPTTWTVQPKQIDSLVADAHPADFPLQVAVLPGAALATGSGVVISADGRVVRETFLDDDQYARVYGSRPRLPAPARVAGRCVSLVSQWSHNFFHWLIEALPRLAVLEASGVEFDRIIVPADAAAFHLESLALLGYGPERIQHFDGEHVRPRELVWCSPLAPVGFPTPYLVDWLRRSFKVNWDDPPTRKLYLSRVDRGVQNGEEVTAFLRSHDFESVDPGIWTFADQIEMFSNAAAAVGPHGAAFANCVFSPRLTAVEFYQSEHANVSMTGVMAAAGHGHWSIAAPRVRSLQKAAHQPMRVPLGDLETTLVAAHIA